MSGPNPGIPGRCRKSLFPTGRSHCGWWLFRGSRGISTAVAQIRGARAAWGPRTGRCGRVSVHEQVISSTEEGDGEWVQTEPVAGSSRSQRESSATQCCKDFADSKVTSQSPMTGPWLPPPLSPRSGAPPRAARGKVLQMARRHSRQPLGGRGVGFFAPWVHKAELWGLRGTQATSLGLWALGITVLGPHTCHESPCQGP